MELDENKFGFNNEEYNKILELLESEDEDNWLLALEIIKGSIKDDNKYEIVLNILTDYYEEGLIDMGTILYLGKLEDKKNG